MPGIPPKLCTQLQSTLLACGLFDSDRDMRGLFSDQRIAHWRNDIPSANTPNLRVSAFVDTMRERRNVSGANALLLALHVLRDRFPPGDALHTKLVELAEALERSLKGKVFICYARAAEIDAHLALHLHQVLSEHGYDVFIDQIMRSGTDWLDEIDHQIKHSDFLITLLSQESANSEMVSAELLRAYNYRRTQGHPQTLPVRIAYEGLLPYSIDAFVGQQQYIAWHNDADTRRVVDEILNVIRCGVSQPVAEQLEPITTPVAVSEDGYLIADNDALHAPLPEFDPRILDTLTAPGGAVRLRDKFYIQRDADAGLCREILGPGTVSTIRASRQSGKSSLLVRGTHYAREHGAKVVFMDLQRVDKDYLVSPDAFLRYMAEFITRKLRLDCEEVNRAWQGRMGPQDKLTCLMEDYLLPEAGTPVVLAMDEVDRLLQTDFHNDFFALLRAWHNSAAYEPVWEQLNIVLVISTEPHLLIQDMNQSPFNVGLKLYLEDFDMDQVRQLNQRHGAPVAEHELPAFMALLGGHPYLTRKALYVMVTKSWRWAQLVEAATSDQGPFGDHLRRYHWLLRDKGDLQDALRQVLRRGKCEDDMQFYRLLRAGLVKGRGDVCKYRCDLYRQYFERKL